MFFFGQPFRDFRVEISSPVTLGEPAQYDAEKAAQAFIEPVDKSQHDLRLGLAQFLKKLAENRKGREVIQLRLGAALNDREPPVRVRLVDLRHEFTDALLPVNRLLFVMKIRIVPGGWKDELEAHERFVDREALIHVHDTAKS